MKKILAGRGMGKTTQLLYYAHYLASKNSKDTIIFVTHNPYDIGRKYRELFTDNKNVNFIPFSFFISNPTMKGYGEQYKIIIDDLDYLLYNLNVVGYSNTIGDIDNEN